MKVGKIVVILISVLTIGAWAMPAQALPERTVPLVSRLDNCPGAHASVSNTGGAKGNVTDIKVSRGACNDSGGTGAARVCSRQAAYVVGTSVVVEEGRVDCANEIGSWSNNHQCYVSVTDQSPTLFGRNDGVVLMCINTSGVLDVWWAPSSPGQVTALSVAMEAAAQLGIRAPETRRTRADTMQVVGFPMWLWVGDPGPGTTEQTTATATLEGVTVSATGTLDKIVYDMGDGHQVVCAGSDAAGTEFRTTLHDGREPSPTCGYIYPDHADTPGSWFTVTATAHWTVTWSGAGQSGTFPVQVAGSFPVQVGEVQTVIVPNPSQR